MKLGMTLFAAVFLLAHRAVGSFLAPLSQQPFLPAGSDLDDALAKARVRLQARLDDPAQFLPWWSQATARDVANIVDVVPNIDKLVAKTKAKEDEMKGTEGTPQARHAAKMMKSDIDEARALLRKRLEAVRPGFDKTAKPAIAADIDEAAAQDDNGWGDVLSEFGGAVSEATALGVKEQARTKTKAVAEVERALGPQAMALGVKETAKTAAERALGRINAALGSKRNSSMGTGFVQLFPLVDLAGSLAAVMSPKTHAQPEVDAAEPLQAQAQAQAQAQPQPQPGAENPEKPKALLAQGRVTAGVGRAQPLPRHSRTMGGTLPQAEAPEEAARPMGLEEEAQAEAPNLAARARVLEEVTQAEAAKVGLAPARPEAALATLNVTQNVTHMHVGQPAKKKAPLARKGQQTCTEAKRKAAMLQMQREQDKLAEVHDDWDQDDGGEDENELDEGEEEGEGEGEGDDEDELDEGDEDHEEDAE